MVGLAPLKPWSIAYLDRQVPAALARAEFDRALALLRDALVSALRAAVREGKLVIGSQDIDALCLEAGRRIAASGNGSGTQAIRTGDAGCAAPLDLFVASEVYRAGGHTGLLGDYMANLGTRLRLLALTNLPNRPRDYFRQAWPRLEIRPEEIALCERPDLAGKCRWLMALIADRRPARVFLFTHPQDSAAIAACQPLRGTEYYFVHHADRLPSLGALHGEFRHIDVTPFDVMSCRRAAGYRDNLYLPIVAADQGARDFSQPRRDVHGLVTAACGTGAKFELDRSELYPSAVSTILTTTAGRHVHIGDLSQASLRHLRTTLRRDGLDPARFVHIPHVPALWRALGEHQVDLYLGSLPHRGARASVEAMGSATPALWYLSGERYRLHDTHMKYPEAAVWRDRESLVAILRAIDAPWLLAQSAAARRHYARYHHPRLLDAALSRPLKTEALPEGLPGLDEPMPASLEDLGGSWQDQLRIRLVSGRSFWRGRLQRVRPTS